MESSEFRKYIAHAMNDMPNPVKDTSAYKYKYATLEQVLHIVREALKSYALTLVQEVTYEPMDGSRVLHTYVQDIDGERLEVDSRRISQTDDAQRDGSYETYSRRYALLTAFGLCPVDDDGAATARRPQSPQHAQQVDPLESAKGSCKMEIMNWVQRVEGDQSTQAQKVEIGRTEYEQKVLTRDDFANTPEWFLAVAEEYRRA